MKKKVITLIVISSLFLILGGCNMRSPKSVITDNSGNEMTFETSVSSSDLSTKITDKNGKNMKLLPKDSN